MSRTEITKGIETLRELAISLRYIIEKNNDIVLMPPIDEMNRCCSVLTDIFEKEFINLIEKEERMDDDGK
jgi:hypothetical protein